MLIRIAFLGFGTVGRALHALLEDRRSLISRDYDVQYIVTGIATRRLGWRAAPAGLNAAGSDGEPCDGVHEWLTRTRADVVFEAMPLDPHSGQPALDHLRAVLEHGAHAISANKGPAVYGYRSLSALAAERGRSYAFEAAVMDGAPVFSLVRDCLPGANLRTIRGVFTSTATVVLEAVERGLSFEEGIREAQRMGIAEADPSYDVDGWDSAVKLCALANVLFAADLRPSDVVRRGVRALPALEVQRAAREGRPYRLIGAVERHDTGAITARVEPMPCSTDGPLGIVRGATLVMHYEADVFPGGLTVTSHDPNPTTTAYGMLADLLRVVTPAR